MQSYAHNTASDNMSEAVDVLDFSDVSSHSPIDDKCDSVVSGGEPSESD